jgi:type IV pilus biogenesis protein PilP
MSATNTNPFVQIQTAMHTKNHLPAIVAVALLAFSAHAQIPANPLEASTPTAAAQVKQSVPNPPPKGVLAPTPAAQPLTPTQLPSSKAQTPVVPIAIAQIQNSAAAMEIQRINENMTVLQAQLNQLELQVKVAGKKRDLSGLKGYGAQSSFDSKKGNPSVVSVAGIKGHLEAVLVFPGSSTQRVKEGDIIDDRRVVKVAANEVILADLKGKNTQRLTFGTSAVIREMPVLQNPTQVGVPMPMMR